MTDLSRLVEGPAATSLPYVDDISTRVDLAMSFTLIVIPDPSAPSREHRLDAQQVCHLLRLENPAPRVDQRNAVAAELEPSREISGTENPALKSSKPVHVAERRLA